VDQALAWFILALECRHPWEPNAAPDASVFASQSGVASFRNEKHAPLVIVLSEESRGMTGSDSIIHAQYVPQESRHDLRNDPLRG
jgi:hypothetical protein